MSTGDGEPRAGLSVEKYLTFHLTKPCDRTSGFFNMSFLKMCGKEAVTCLFVLMFRAALPSRDICPRQQEAGHIAVGLAVRCVPTVIM